jgi:hypothetical protein
MERNLATTERGLARYPWRRAMEQKLATCLRTEREPRLETQREPAVILARVET